MFTGIVEEYGTLVRLERGRESARLIAHGPLVTSDARSGDSIAVNGVCLTVTDLGEGTFTADVMAETLACTTLGGLAGGAGLNLERALAAGGRLGGHLVSGHVDGTGEVLAREAGEAWELVTIGIPETLSRYVVPKGSLAVDGVSLTVAGVQDAAAGCRVTVSLIPETLHRTTLGRRAVGERVNLEVDMLAKYVERLVTPMTAGRP
jgi:riboflavin synthase